MPMQTIFYLSAFLIGFGASVLCFLLFRFLVETLQAVQLRGQYHSVPARGSAELLKAPVDLSRISFPFFFAYSIAILIAALLWFSLSGLLLQPLSLLVLFFPYFVYRRLSYLRRQHIQNEVRQFLTDLRLELSAGGTLLQALRHVVRGGPPIISNLLSSYLASYQGSGLEILERLAQDTKNSSLQDVAYRVSASQYGSLGLDEAIRQSLDRVVEESQTRVLEDLQRIPDQFIWRVYPLLMAPAIVLWVYPLGNRVLETIRGVGSFGGF